MTRIPAPSRPGSPEAPVGYITPQRVQRIRRILGALESRQRSTVNLYEPLPNQLAFHQSHAPERLVRGSNQAGKTLCAVMEVAWAALGCHPYLDYPAVDGKIYIVGKDEQHLADPLYEKLFRPGAFEIIRDEQTQEWRAYRPWTDEHRKRERRDADPLIPERMIKSVSWRLKKSNTPKTIVLKNGWRLYFYPSSGKPKQGTQIHLALFDEEVIDLSWKAEVDLRLMRYGGRFVWAATPHTSSQGLLDLHDRATEDLDKERPAVTEHRLLIKDNPHIPEEHKQAMFSKITSPDEYLIRVEGEFATAGFLVYPEFDMRRHGCERFPIPNNWTRYMVVDPGYQTACALFFAVPPEDQEHPQHVYLFDEIYANNCDANRFAELCASKVGENVYYEFVIDSHASRVTPMSGGLTIGQQYEKSFIKFGVQSLRTKFGFVGGMDDVKAGNLAVHDWLHVRPQEGTPKLQVFRGCVPNFEHEIKRYRKKQDKTSKAYLDDPQQKNNHAMDALRYARGRDFKWHRCPTKLLRNDSLYHRFKRAMEAKKDPGKQAYVNLGPGDAA